MKRWLVCGVAATALTWGFAASSLSAQDAAAKAPAEPATGPASRAADAQTKALAEATKAKIAFAREGPTCQRDELFRLSVVGGQLRCESGPYAPPRGALMRLKVEGSDDVWLVQGLPEHVPDPHAPVPKFVQLLDFDEAERGGFWRIMLTARGTPRINAMSGEGYVEFTSDAAHVALSLRDKFSFEAPSLRQLEAGHPQEVRQCLLPMLRKLASIESLHAGPADRYAAFADIPADPAVAAKVAALLPGLDADDFAARDNASKELAKLGGPGVLAALHVDGSKLSSEQKARFDAFVAAQGQRTAIEPQAALKDLSFLVDALGDDDPRVVAAAQKAIEKLIGHPVAYEPQADPVKRAAAQDALWSTLDRELRPKAPPATAPAATAP